MVLLAVLREYWKIDRPPEYLFPGQGTSGHVAAGLLPSACHLPIGDRPAFCYSTYLS